MRRVYIFLPLAALIAFAAYLGWQRGQPPSDTEIINRYAAAYLEIAPTGASPTDCAATPHPDDAIRMVINCVHPFGLTTTYFTGPRGEALPQPLGPGA
ncbi:hypothetical protein [Loktanella sp. Alg231-35]|uniref:hypothetical protein n=1 Tax=Loktanella sp. Alg231-35 TaxID=1922220 RepID=UPI000D55192F|nr:hypothetical protein [Loktanella sp. Alg231-35]